MKSPRVSVLIPCYNASATIAETLDCVLAQTFRDIEIVVVDDGSTDGSGDIVRGRYGDAVKLVTQANGGPSAAMNTALRNASGDFIQYLDADDIIDPEKIEVQLTRLLSNPGAIASARWGRFYTTADTVKFVTEDVYADLSPPDWLALSRITGLDMMFPALWLIPREVVDRAGLWNESLTLSNDTEYFTRIVLASEQVLFCEEAKCRYRSGRPSMSASRKLKHWASKFAVLHLCEGYVRRREDSARIRLGFARSWQHFAHESYPYAPGLAETALRRAAELSDEVIVPDGGPLFQKARAVLGWRLARRLQVWTGRK